MGPYRIVGRLGAGGMGIVYAGVDSAGRRAAVKLIHDMHATNQEFRIRFRREVEMLRRVQGTCCVRMLAADAEARQPWLATEYIAGRTLDEHVRVEGPLSGDGLYGLAAGLAEALVAVHAAGVVHRDLKPSNVMILPQGPRLVDFGIARSLDGTSLTASGHVIGSPGWVSPEDYAGAPAGPAADVYGWALVVVYAAMGEQPYGAGRRPEVLAHRVMTATVDTARVPEGIRPTVDRALAKAPEARPAMDDVLAVVADAWRGHHGEKGRMTWDPATDVTSRLKRVWAFPAVDAAHHGDAGRHGDAAHHGDAGRHGDAAHHGDAGRHGDTAARGGGIADWPSEPVRARKSLVRRAAPAVAVVAAIGCAGVILLDVQPGSSGGQRPKSSAPATAAT
ncbi:serine/threonine protein kinase, partial [Nonomuraea deserti]